VAPVAPVAPTAPVTPVEPVAPTWDNKLQKAGLVSGWLFRFALCREM